MIALYMLCGLILFRFRGGMFPTGSDVIARSGYSVGMAILCWLGLGNPWTMASVPLWYLGATVGWFGSHSMGTGCHSYLRDALVIIPRGIWFTLLPGLLLWHLGAHWWLIAAGALTVVAYSIGDYIPSKIKHFSQGMQLSEAIYGAMLGASLYLSLSGVV